MPVEDVPVENGTAEKAFAKPFRFIHTAGLLLDHQLRHTGVIPSAWHDVVCHASRVAFEHLIEACLAHDVDALLLVGDSFDAADVGFSGQSRLARGLERLADRDIPVFIVPDGCDPWSGWLPGLRFSDNVYRLGHDADPCLPLERDGELLATLQGLAGRAVTTDTHSGLPRPDQFAVDTDHPTDAFRIALLADELPESANTLPAMNYWALGGPGDRTTRPVGTGIAHHPGSPQAFWPSQTGPHGCSLVEIDASGTVHTQFLPTAPIRFERLEADLSSVNSRTELEQALVQELIRKERHTSDRLWLVDWRVSGNNAVVNGLSNEERQALIADLPRLAGWEGMGVLLRHVSETQIPPSSTEDLRLAEFDAELQQRFAQGNWTAQQLVAESNLHEGPWETRLERLLSRLDHSREEDPTQAARRKGQSWFAANS